MHDNEQRAETISDEIHELMRGIVSAIRAVKLYPPNNPIYSQTVGKSFNTLDQYLKSMPEFRISLQKSGFYYNGLAVDRDTQLYKSIASDLFHKGIREITFTQGITEPEILSFYTIVSMPQEDINLGGGIGSLLWEKGDIHVKIKDASLDDVVHGGYTGRVSYDDGVVKHESSKDFREYLRGKDINIFGRKVMLCDITDSPVGFGAMMIEMAGSAGIATEKRIERLFEFYREAGSQILQKSFERHDHLFNAMAESIISMDPAYQEGLIAKRLYVEVDRDAMQSQMKDVVEQIPHGLTEMTSARFSRLWTVPQVSSLLKKASSLKASAAFPPSETRRLAYDLYEISRDLSEYTPEEMESLRKMAEFGPDAGMVESVIHTLIHILPLAQYSIRPQPFDKTHEQFSRIAGLLEDMLVVLLDKKDYALAASVLRAFKIPAEPAFRQRLADAVKRAGDKKRISQLFDDIRAVSKNSAEYHAIYSYLSLLDREATPVLLEMLAEEEDRSIRRLLVQILKDLGRNQIAMLGEKLSDERWYFVRNIVGILGESRKEDVISYLEKVAGHKNFQIRQEVVRALISIGGRKAADLLTRFLNDKDIDIRFMAVRGLGHIPASGEREERALMAFIQVCGVKGAQHELKKEAVYSLGRIGGPGSLRFLKKYSKIKWWKARKPQEEIRAAALSAGEDIERRIGDAGRAKGQA